MKQKVKLDRILYALYPKRFSRTQYSIEEIMDEADIPYESGEPYILAKRLNDDGLVDATFAKNYSSLKLSSYGIDYCEESSYNEPKTSVINIYSIIGSSGNTINVNNSVQNYYENSHVILELIAELRRELQSIDSVSGHMITEIGECLDEIDSKVKSNSKVPSALARGLLSISADLTTIYPKFKELVNHFT